MIVSVRTAGGSWMDFDPKSSRTNEHHRAEQSRAEINPAACQLHCPAIQLQVQSIHPSINQSIHQPTKERLQTASCNQSSCKQANSQSSCKQSINPAGSNSVANKQSNFKRSTFKHSSFRSNHSSNQSRCEESSCKQSSCKQASSSQLICNTVQLQW